MPKAGCYIAGVEQAAGAIAAVGVALGRLLGGLFAWRRGVFAGAARRSRGVGGRLGRG